ncbi:MAG: phosphatase PAP2 family protein [Nostocaceae cyanobacterium]|nr:phosphatase PAP2 family protein [Nostocaceae cyanobacterium]
MDTFLVRAIHTAVKGRARYKIDGLRRNLDLQRHLEIKLSKYEEIREYRLNSYTGNILVFFPTNLSADAIASLIQEIVLDYRQSVFKPFQTSALSPIIPLTGVISALAFTTAIINFYNLDTRILLAIQKLHTPLFDSIILSITLLGEPAVLLLICLASRFTPLYKNRPHQADKLAITTLGSIGLIIALKSLFARTRPALWDWILHVGHYSFPSGHAMLSTVVYGFIAYSLAKQYPQHQRQIFALAAALIVAIGFSRLYLGVHWTTDVTAGYAIGLVWLIVCILCWEMRQKDAYLWLNPQEY